MSDIPWLPWSDDAFRKAEAEQKPILLSLVARWCGLCKLMDRTTFSDPDVGRLVAQFYVPVRVDADERPDINERYNLGAWPTTAFLAPEGDLLAGGTFFEPPHLKQMLVQLQVGFSTRRKEIEEAVKVRDAKIRQAEQVVAYARKTGLNHEVLRKTVRGIAATFDPAHGGFGRQPKFPMPPSVAVMLRAFFDTGGPDFEEILHRTLGAMADRDLYDHGGSGFFRYVTSENWTGPQFEKLAEDNAALAQVFLDAWLVTGVAKYRDRGVGALEYVRGTLLDASGLFAVAQDGDEEHYADRKKPAPPVDRRFFAGPNAVVASAFLRAGFALGDPSLVDVALRCLEGMEPRKFLLRDHVLVARACLDAYEATGQGAWRERGAGLLDRALRQFRSEEGGLCDRLPGDGDRGELARTKRNIAENAIAGEQLLRLAALVDDSRFRVEAEAILTSFPDFLDDYGHYTAEYSIAMDRAVRPPVEIDLDLPAGADRAHPLVRTALVPFVPRRIVRWHESPDRPSVRIRIGDTLLPPAHTPDEVASRLDRSSLV